MASVTTPSYELISASSPGTPSTMPPRAIQLKGPSTNSRTYFVPLPETLDQLIELGLKYFSIPPEKVPIITLRTDERAILVQEVMPFVRDRETLIFRYDVATPKRSAPGRVRWEQPTSVQYNVREPSSSVKSSAKAMTAFDLCSPSTSRPSAATAAPLLAAKANMLANSDPKSRFGEGVAARQAHAKRVLQEQRVKEEARRRRLAALHAGEARPVERTATETKSRRDTSLEVFGKPASPTAPLESPPRKRHPDAVPLDTPPSSGSRSISPYRSGERKLMDEGKSPLGEEDQTSSPIQSPTRDLSAARAQKTVALAMSDISNAISKGADLQRALEEKATGKPTSADEPARLPWMMADNQLEAIAVAAEQAASVTDNVTESHAAAEAEQIPVSNAEASAPAPQETPEPVEISQENTVSKEDTVPDPDIEKTYRWISNLVDSLLSHRSNTFFNVRNADFMQQSSWLTPPVDLFSIQETIREKAYGSHFRQGTMAAKVVMLDFERELKIMYTNARRIYGTKSAQSQCADHLEKFSDSLIEEWTRAMNVAKKMEQPRASSTPTSSLSPYRRGEKRLVPGPYGLVNIYGSLFARGGEAMQESNSRQDAAAQKLKPAPKEGEKELDAFVAFERAVRGGRPASAAATPSPPVPAESKTPASAVASRLVEVPMAVSPKKQKVNQVTPTPTEEPMAEDKPAEPEVQVEASSPTRQSACKTRVSKPKETEKVKPKQVEKAKPVALDSDDEPLRKTKRKAPEPVKPRKRARRGKQEPPIQVLDDSEEEVRRMCEPTGPSTRSSRLKR